MEMERGNLHIEQIPETERHYRRLSDYGSERKKKSQMLRPNTLYKMPEIEDKHLSRWWWLGSDKERGVRVTFHPEDNSSLEIWELPNKRDRYVIGVMGAMDPENKLSVATVLNVRTLTQVAELAAKLLPDLFAVEIFKLSILYNLALMAVESSDCKHGLSILTALMDGNPQYNVLRLGKCSLLYQERVLDKVKNEFTNKVGFEMKEDRKRLIFDNLFAAIREKKIKLCSEKLLNELTIPTLIEEDKADQANRAYAMAICYEMARLYPYRPPSERKERESLADWR